MSLRILLISSMVVPVPPPRYGGVERVAYDLAVSLHAEGHEIGVVAPDGSALPSDIMHLNGGRPGSADAELRALESYRTRLGEFELVCDLSHLKLARTYFSNQSRSVYIPVCGTTYLPKFDTPTPRVVCVSKAHAAFIKAKYGVEPKVIYNGIDVEQYGPPLPMSQREDRVLFIGRFASEKGALEALKFGEELNLPIDVIEGRLNEPAIMSLYRYLASVGFPGLSLVSRFYHGEVDLEYLRKVYAQMKKTKVRYFSNLEHERKRELLRMSKAFIFPLQWEEPFGLTVVEAAASGLPVIAYSRGSMPELIADGVTGFLIPPNDREQFAERIKEAGSIDPMWCVDHVRKNFSKKVMASRYERLFTAAKEGERW